MEVKLLSKSDLGRRIQTAALMVAAHGPEAVQAVETMWEPVLREYDALKAEKVRIDENVGFNFAGKEAAHRTLEETRGAAFFARIDQLAEAIRRLYGDLQGAENAAQQGLRKTNDGGYVKDPAASQRIERTPEVLAQEQEIRREIRVQGLVPREIDLQYLEAVAKGDDPVFVSAIENAPMKFPLVSDGALAIAREIRISRSPWAVEIASLRAVYDSHCYLLEAAGTGVHAAFPGLRHEAPRVEKLKPMPRVPVGVEKLLEGLRVDAPTIPFGENVKRI